MVPAAIYVRQSITREGSESMQNQEETCRAAASRMGLNVVEAFIEPPSTSGYKERGRGRPRFLQLLEAVRAGRVQAIVVYKSDRLSRGGGPGWAPVFDAAEAQGLDLDRLVCTPAGWMSEMEIGFRAVMDREESKKLSDRITDVRRREARDGRPRGGGLRPYGYGRDLITVLPDEAERIQEAARRIISGESAWGVAKAWNLADVPGPGGGRWSSQTLKRLLRSGRVAGLRNHRGELYEATWEPILDRPTWEGARQAMADNGYRKPQRAPVVRSFLLSGFAVCGRCGSTLWGRTRNAGRREYSCSNQQTNSQTSCGRLVVHADPVEAFVFDVIRGTVLQPDYVKRIIAAAPAVSDGRDLGAELATVNGKVERLLDLFTDGDITKEAYRARRTDLDREREQVYSELRNRSGSNILSNIPTTDEELRQAWESQGIEWRRLVVAAVISRLEVAPGRMPRPADRVRLTLA